MVMRGADMEKEKKQRETERNRDGHGSNHHILSLLPAVIVVSATCEVSTCTVRRWTSRTTEEIC